MENQDFFLKILNIIIWPILVFLIVLLFKKPVYGFLVKLNKFRMNTNALTVEVNILEEGQTKQSIDNVVTSVKNSGYNPDPHIEKLEIIVENQKYPSEEVSLSDIISKIQTEDLIEVEREFNQFIISLTDQGNVAWQKAYFHYQVMKSGRSHTAQETMLKLFNLSNTEEEKLAYSFWYEEYFSDYKNYTTAIEFYLKNINSFTSSAAKTEVLVRISRLYLLNQEVDDAGMIIERRISEVESPDELYQLYNCLSKVEKEKENYIISALCLDKALEYKPSDSSLLFSSSYEASNVDINFIGICNYDTLIDIDSQHQDALNNLSVAAENEGVRSISSNYNQSAIDNNSSLAMTNKGYKLLKIGLTKEAEEIAKQALDAKEPHANAYSLMKAIENKREEDSKAWLKIKSKSESKQKLARKYTENYYKSEPKQVFPGTWLNIDGNKVEFLVVNNKLEVVWEKEMGNILSSTYTLKYSISGSVHNSSFRGTYTESRSTSSIFSGSTDKNIECLGFFDNTKNKMFLFSTKLKDDFEMIFEKS